MGKKILNIKKNKFLLIIFLIAVFLRTYNIKHTLLFHYDQGYHGLAIKHIWDNKDLTLLGHKADVEGIFHSSLFYYLMLPLYLISGWNPVGVSTILAVIDAISVVFIYLTAKKLFDQKTGLISALLYAVSYSVISYSRWLSNVTLIPFLSSLMFYLLALSGGKKIRYYSLALFVAGVIAQLNGAIGFFLLPLLVIYLIYFKKDLLKNMLNLIKFFFYYSFPSIGLLVFDIRNSFLVTKSIVNLFTSSENNWLTSLGLQRVIRIISSQLTNLLTYQSIFMALALLMIIVYSYKKIWVKKEKKHVRAKEVLALVLTYIFLLFIYQGIHDFFIVAIIPLMVIAIGWSLGFLFRYPLLKYMSIAVLATTVLLNLYHWTGFLRPNFNLVPIGTRNLITLEDRIKAIDYMYGKAADMPFRTEIYIIPYYQEEPWDYVFNWYAYSKYGYIPQDEADKVFLIYEPDYDYHYRLDTWLDKANEKYGEVKSNFKSNSLIVEERERS